MEGRGRGSWRGGEGGRREGGRGRPSEECSCADCGRQAPSLLYRCSTECNLPRNLCTGMRQTSRNERFILAHARMQRYFVLIQRPGARHHRHHALAYMNRTQRITRRKYNEGGEGGGEGERDVECYLPRFPIYRGSVLRPRFLRISSDDPMLREEGCVRGGRGGRGEGGSRKLVVPRVLLVFGDCADPKGFANLIHCTRPVFRVARR